MLKVGKTGFTLLRFTSSAWLSG